MKATFKHLMEWSDRSEFSPSHRGQLPAAVITPNGQRIDLDDAEIFAAAADFAGRHPTSRATYIPMTRDGSVRVKLSTWGDDGRRSYGRAGATLEVIAPAGSSFRFWRYCPICGEATGESNTAAETTSERDGEAHQACASELAEQRALMAEAHSEARNWYKRQ